VSPIVVETMAESLVPGFQDLDLDPNTAEDPQIVIGNLVERCQALYEEIEQYIAAVDANQQSSKSYMVEYKNLRCVRLLSSISRIKQPESCAHLNPQSSLALSRRQRM
jgi:hypothetical protein